MAPQLRSRILKLLTFACLLAFPITTFTQTPANEKLKSTSAQTQLDKIRETDLREAERRTFAISLVTALAHEARSYDDLSLRARVLARVADTLWDVDGVTARSLFGRAWEAAEEADAQEPTAKTKDNLPSMVIALKRISGRDLRMEVLSMAARRDRILGEAFLAKLKDENIPDPKDSRNDARLQKADNWLVSEQITKRLLLARKLIDDNQTELALEIAAPALNEVNAHSINFLSRLRELRADVADAKFSLLMAHAEMDPRSDANTVSGLSSYIISPGYYVTFSPDGGSRWSQPEGATASPSFPLSLRNRFFQVAAAILLRPSPPPNQDFSSAGRLGKYMVIKRLLPFFDQNAPDTAAALRGQLTTLAGDLPKTEIREESSRINHGINLAEKVEDPLQKMQDQLDRASSSRERDEIYAEAAMAFTHRGDARAKDLADKIEDSRRRSQLHQYVALHFIQLAIRKKDASEVVRLAKSGQLTHQQRVWAYTQAAKLMNSERALSLELLGEAALEARRINADDPDRPRSLVAVATQFVAVDQVRAWEIMGEAVKAANSIEKFTGENEQLTFTLLVTRSGMKTISIRAEDFALAGLIRALTEADLTRTVDVAKSFRNPAPRATAILATAGAVLNRKAAGPPPQRN